MPEWINSYEKQLSGGHHNSLGNTVEVVEHVLESETRVDDLLDCYRSADGLVRLRVSNAVKRICKIHPAWVAKRLELLLGDVAEIDQASTKWTLSTLFMKLDELMTDKQRQQAIGIMKQNLHYDDWIVNNTTAESLAHFAKQDEELRAWLLQELKKLTNSRH